MASKKIVPINISKKYQGLHLENLGSIYYRIKHQNHFLALSYKSNFSSKFYSRKNFLENFDLCDSTIFSYLLNKLFRGIMLKKISYLALVATLASCSGGLFKSSAKTDNAKPVVKSEAVKSEEKSEEKFVVYFDTDSAELTADTTEMLTKKVAPMVKEVLKESNGRILIEGHCDERGSIAYNKKLGKKRAEAVKKFLVNSGAKSKKISVKSLGKSKPVEMGHNEEAWSKNRRAVTISVRM